MSSFFIQPVGFAEQEHVWLEAILTIGRNTLRDDWRWTLSGPADVCLVAVGSITAWDRYRSELSSSYLVACASPNLDINARWRIDREGEKLPALRQMTQVLNALGAEIASSETPPAAATALAVPGSSTVTPQPDPVVKPCVTEATQVVAEGQSQDADLHGAIEEVSMRGSAPEESVLQPSAPVAAGDDIYDPEKYLIGIVRECLADGLPRRLSCPGGGMLLIDPARNQCVMQEETAILCPILSAARDQIEVHLLSKVELMGATVTAHGHVISITDILFLSVLTGSQGRIWAGCDTDEPVRLKQWPGLGHLPDSVEYVNLAAFMSGNNIDIYSIAERTGMPQDRVIDFHNACMAIDLLDRGGEIVIREKSINPNVRDLYQKIAKRLQGEI